MIPATGAPVDGRGQNLRGSNGDPDHVIWRRRDQILQGQIAGVQVAIVETKSLAPSRRA
jgi:hypothetical protein